LLVLFFPIAALLGIIAIILGIIGMGRARRGEADNRGQALAGLVTGVVALLVAIFFTVSIGAYFGQHQNDFRTFGNCMMGADTEQQRRDCVDRLGNRLER
jgi:multisubunit Na+/H+ antiporter MnhB subunit